jgi:hypothetical protein
MRSGPFYVQGKGHNLDWGPPQILKKYMLRKSFEYADYDNSLLNFRIARSASHDLL